MTRSHQKQRMTWMPAGGLAFALVFGTGAVLGLAGAKPLERLLAPSQAESLSPTQTETPAEPSGPPGTGLPVPIAITVLTAQNGYRVEERYVGRLEPKRKTALGFTRGGVIDQFFVSIGDPVSAGQPLARLNTDALLARAEELRFGLAESTSKLGASAIALEQAASIDRRRASLGNRDWVSREARDEAAFNHRKAAAEHEAARNAMRGAEASLARIEVDLAESILTAPYDGIIMARRVNQGAAFGPGEAILDLMDREGLEFRVGIPEAMRPNFLVGQEYPVEFDTKTTMLRLDSILPEVDPATRTVTAILSGLDQDEASLSGALGRLVTTRQITKHGFWVPLTALTESYRGLWAIYAVDSNTGGDVNSQHVSRRDIQIHHIGADAVFVTGVLETGDRIVATGVHRLTQGMPVEVVSVLEPTSPDR